MTADVELLLVIAILAFYLKDSLVLLDSDQALIGGREGRRRTAGFGARSWKLAGREPYLANPFTPHRPLMRLRWSMHGDAVETADAVVPAALAGLPALVWTMWIALFVVVPVLLMVRRDPVLLAVTVAVLYACAMAALVLVWRRREALRLDTRRFAVLAFECIACVPCAVNLIRKLSMSWSYREDFVHAAERLLDESQQSDVRRACLARIDEQIEAESDENAATDAMRRARLRFISESP